ncbi:MAG: PAS domain S-box protein, partial [Candidatus Riflebacteria bacterium]|nr:PAS domain S-box protein [Candidatus Riflebacteria bacterium]
MAKKMTGALTGAGRTEPDSKRRKRPTRSKTARDHDLLRAVFENALDGLALADVSTRRFVDANPAFCRMLGYTLQEIRRLLITDIHPAGDLAHVLDQFEQQAAGALELAHDIPILCKDGAVIYADVNSTVVTVAGRPCLLGVFRDVTTRREAQEAHRQSEQLYRLFFNGITDAVFVHGVTDEGLPGQFVAVNDLACRRLGYTRQELLQLTPLDIDAPESTVNVRSITESLQRGESRLFEQIHVAKDGRRIPVEINVQSFLVQGRTMVLSVVRDITSRRQLDEALRQESAFKTAVIERAAEGLCVCHEIPEFPRVRFTIWNERMRELTGYSLEEINRSGWYQSLHPDPEAQGRAMARMKRMSEGEDIRGEEWEITRADGARRIIELSTSVVSIQDGRPQILALMQDVTDQKLAAKAIRESEERHRATLSSMTDMVFVLDSAGRFLDWHAPDPKKLYRSPDDFLGRSFREVLPPDVPKQLEDALADTERLGAVRSLDYEMEIQGRRTWWSATVGPRRDGSGRYAGVTIVVRDVTERKLLGDRLRQSEKLTAIGQLAGGIAHDFNNQLARILGFSDLLVKRLAPGPLRQFAKDIVRSAQRAADLTRQLLAVGRRGKNLSAPVNVHDLVREVTAILERSIDRRIRIRQTLDARSAVIVGDPTLIQNALLNLALNARDAMPSGGEL